MADQPLSCVEHHDGEWGLVLVGMPCTAVQLGMLLAVRSLFQGPDSIPPPPVPETSFHARARMCTWPPSWPWPS